MSALWAVVAVAAIVVLVAVFVRPSEPAEDDSRPDPDAAIRPLVRGIHYLVAEDPDRALHELVEVARTHGAELAEVYLALGDLFRARGEYLRAVRIHQS
ncbi:MAG: heat-shock protein, partial [Zetaproteobacteria bacterium]